MAEGEDAVEEDDESRDEEAEEKRCILRYGFVCLSF